MLIKSIRFPSYFKDIKDIKNVNIDVFVESEDGYMYTATIGTVKNIEYLMNKNNMNYFWPSNPFIIVKELTEEIIKETLTAYAEKNNGYWLKLHHFSVDIEESVFDRLQARRIKSLEELNESNNS